MESDDTVDRRARERDFSHTNYEDFQDELKRRKIQMNRLIDQTIGNQRGLQGIFDEASEKFRKRKVDFIVCIKKLDDDIAQLKTDLNSSALDIGSVRLKKLELENKELFRKLVKEEKNKEEDYKIYAMRDLMMCVCKQEDISITDSPNNSSC